jgi:hypothetical protein
MFPKQAISEIGADVLLHQHKFVLDLGLSTTAVGGRSLTTLTKFFPLLTTYLTLVEI